MTEAVDLESLWDTVIASVDVPTRAWLRRTRPIAMHGTTMMLAVTDEPTRERVETRLRQLIEQHLSERCGEPTHLAVMIDPNPGPRAAAARGGAGGRGDRRGDA